MKFSSLLLAGLVLPLSPALFSTASAAAPNGKPEPDLKWDHMNLGPFQAGTFKVDKQLTVKGLAVKLWVAASKGATASAVTTDRTPDGTALFDTELLRWSAAWTGGFIHFPRGRGGLEGQIEPVGKVALSSSYAPGWATGGEVGDDPRDRHQGHLPTAQAKYRGLFEFGNETVLSYTVGQTAILELPGILPAPKGAQRANAVNAGTDTAAASQAAAAIFTRTFRIEPTTAGLTLLLADLPGANGTAESSTLMLSEQGKTDPTQTRSFMAAGLHLPAGAKFRIAPNGRAVLDLPALKAPTAFTVLLWSGTEAEAPKAADLLALEPAHGAAPDLLAFTKGGPAHWGAPLEAAGVVSDRNEAYVGDEIVFPENNPFGSWFRPGGHDFFKDGRAVVVSISGDVWIVSGLDEKLEHVMWKRFATGLFQPLGVKVVNETVYVLGRDQITRLRDLNGDGEADAYECFNNDCVVTENYHEFALDLQTDAAGNFYFAKGSPWQPTVLSEHQGTLLKVSADGSKLEVLATGLRAPNGMGMGPNGELSVSDNQGHWMPANRLNLVKPGGFYGMVPAAHKVLTFADPKGETYKADPSSPKDQAEHKQNFWGSAQTPTPKEGYDLPLCWLPMVIDNSSGGEVWVPKGEKWGPLGGQMLQMSYGKCTLFSVLREEVDGVAQAGVVKFPIKFSSGIMRGRFSPMDDQLYLTGLKVWQSDAGKDGCFYRVRYTGKPVAMPLAQKTTAKGVDITFSCPLDEKLAVDKESYDVSQWNYLWSGAYGSPDFSVRDPAKKGRDVVTISGITLSPDHRTVSLELQDFRPAMQMLVKFKLAGADGTPIQQEIYSTVHRVPGYTAPSGTSSGK